MPSLFITFVFLITFLTLNFTVVAEDEFPRWSLILHSLNQLKNEKTGFDLGVELLEDPTPMPAFVKAGALFFLEQHPFANRLTYENCTQESNDCTAWNCPDEWACGVLNSHHPLSFKNYCQQILRRWGFTNLSENELENIALFIHANQAGIDDWVVEYIAEQAELNPSTWSDLIKLNEALGSYFIHPPLCNSVLSAMEIADTPNGKSRMRELWYASKCELTIMPEAIFEEIEDDEKLPNCETLLNTDADSLLHTIQIAIQCSSGNNSTIPYPLLETVTKELWAAFCLSIIQSNERIKIEENPSILLATLLFGSEIALPEWMRIFGLLYLTTEGKNDKSTIQLAKSIVGQASMALTRNHGNQKSLMAKDMVHLLMGNSYIRQRQALINILNSTYASDIIKELKLLKNTIHFYDKCTIFNRLKNDLKNLTKEQQTNLDTIIHLICSSSKEEL